MEVMIKKTKRKHLHNGESVKLNSRCYSGIACLKSVSRPWCIVQFLLKDRKK